MKKATSKTTERNKHREEAASIAAQYRIMLAPHGDEGFVGSAIELPLVMGRGTTEAQCIADTRSAIIGAVAYLLEAGKQPPAPAAENKREVQLNIRLTPDERVRIEERARQAGFRSVSDYIRRAALRGVG